MKPWKKTYGKDLKVFNLWKWVKILSIIIVIIFWTTHLYPDFNKETKEIAIQADGQEFIITELNDSIPLANLLKQSKSDELSDSRQNTYTRFRPDQMKYFVQFISESEEITWHSELNASSALLWSDELRVYTAIPIDSLVLPNELNSNAYTNVNYFPVNKGRC